MPIGRQKYEGRWVIARKNLDDLPGAKEQIKRKRKKARQIVGKVLGEGSGECLPANNRSCLRQWRKQIAVWLAEQRKLALNPGKGHIRSTQTTQTYLGYRVSPWGRQPGKEMVRRFEKALPNMLSGSESQLEARLIAWRGLVSW